MSYFPAFINLKEKKILIVGGGNIAFEKLGRLLDFTKNIDIIAIEYAKQMEELIVKEALEYKKSAYQKGDILGYDVVIVAVDDIDLQKTIFQESRESRCLCNAVDCIEYCDFIFSAYIKEGDLTVAISTSGASPAFAKHFKRYLKKAIPKGVSGFLQEMRSLRSSMPKSKKRMDFLDKKAENYIKDWSSDEQC